MRIRKIHLLKVIRDFLYISTFTPLNSTTKYELYSKNLLPKYYIPRSLKNYRNKNIFNPEGYFLYVKYNLNSIDTFLDISVYIADMEKYYGIILEIKSMFFKENSKNNTKGEWYALYDSIS